MTSLPGDSSTACGTAAARQIKRRPAGVITAAPGHGLQPRTRLTRSRAGSERRSQPSSFLRRGAMVACELSWGRGVSESSCSSVRSITLAPIRLNRADSSPAASSAPMAVDSESNTSPVSMPGSIWKVVMPVSVSPRMIAHAMGAAPR
jgi:hypothetical protein